MVNLYQVIKVLIFMTYYDNPNQLQQYHNNTCQYNHTKLQLC